MKRGIKLFADRLFYLFVTFSLNKKKLAERKGNFEFYFKILIYFCPATNMCPRNSIPISEKARDASFVVNISSGEGMASPFG